MRPFLILFFIPIFSFAQAPLNKQKKRDSILYYLNETQDSLRHSFLKKAMLLSKEIDDDSLLRVSTIDYGLESYFKKDTTGIKEACYNLQHLYVQNNDSISLAKEYHYRALKYRTQYKLDSSYYYYNLSKEAYIALKDSIEVGRRLLSMAYMQNDEKDYVGAEATAIRALEFLVPLDEIRYKGDSYNILGNALANLGDYEEARKYYEISRQVFNESSNVKFKTGWELYLINNIGYTYLLEKKYSEASKYFYKGLSFDSIKFKYSNHYQVLLGNYSDCLYIEGKKKESLENYDEILRIREKENNIYGQSLSHNGFAFYYDLEGKRKKALFHAKKGYALAKQVNNNVTRLSALIKLVNLTSGAESKEYFKEYTTLSDSLNKRERFFKKQFANIRYETEKKEKENTDLKLQTTEQQAQIERDQLQMIILSLVGVIVIVVLVTYYSNRRKKLMYQAQLQKASAREEERQQIAKSLHDEVAGDLRMLHRKLTNTEYKEEANSLDKIKENVRNLSHQLSSVSFDEVSFKDQMINLVADNFSLDFRIKVEGVDSVLWETVNSAIKRTLYLCARESLQNTLKYAEASKFFIRFSSEKKEILLLLEDNGKGFDLTKGKKGIGLKNLKERVEEIQGSFQIQTSEQGTKTTISIPINGR